MTDRIPHVHYEHCSIEDCRRSALRRGLCRAHLSRLERTGRVDAHIPITEFNRGGRQWLRDHVGYAGDDCLIGPFKLSNKGYPRIGSTYAHRVMCELVHGEAPTTDHQAAHSCGRGHLGCVNPKHLRWATRSENQLERVVHGTSNRGRANRAAVLNETAVRKMRSLFPSHGDAEIARQFGVAPATVTQVRVGKTWGWVR